MKNKLLPIFATQNDLLLVIKVVTLDRQLDFVDSGLFDKAPSSLIKYDGNILPFRTYLAFDKGLDIKVRKIPQRGGGEKYAVHTETLSAVSIHYGGMFKGERLIASQISPVGDDETSGEIYELLRRVIHRRFEKINSYYVGPESLKLLDSGVRLTSTAKSPETHDLTRL